MNIILCLFLAIAAFANPLPRDLVHIVETKNAKLFCRVFGKGKPLIVVHGGPGLSHEYLLSLTQLAEHNTVIFYDQRYAGQSTGSIEDVNLETLIEDIEAIRKSFRFEKVSLFGHSWGAFLAMNYANLHSDHVDKLILCAGMPATSEDLRLFIQEYMKRTAPINDELNSIHESKEYLAGDPKTVAKHLSLMFSAYCASPEAINHISFLKSKEANLRGSQIHEQLTKSVFFKPYDLDLSHVTCKTLVIHGENDIVPVKTAEHTHEKIANSQFVVIKDAGHFVYVEKPEPFYATIQQFLVE